MRKTVVLKFPTFAAVGLLSLAVAGALAGCSGGSTPPSAPAADATNAANDAKAAELATREQELARREAELAAKDQEVQVAKQAEENARRESEAAARAAADKKAARNKPKPSRSASAGASSGASAPASTKPAPAPVPVALQVPAGTQLTLALSSDLSSKTATPGDAFEASLVSNLMVGNRVAVPAGSRVTGTVTDVISGSNAIGAVPMLGLKFNHIELGGQQIAINGEINEQGKSEKVQDTAKILGGVAAGAVLGHQVKTNNRGKIIGGLLGGAIGAVAAKKTGSEVTLTSGSTLTIALGEGFTVYKP